MIIVIFIVSLKWNAIFLNDTVSIGRIGWIYMKNQCQNIKSCSKFCEERKVLCIRVLDKKNQFAMLSTYADTRKVQS